MIPTRRSLVQPDALARVVGAAYGLAVGGCVLLRSLVNDVYELRAGRDRYALKLYLNGHRDRAAVDWEIELADRIAAAGVPVATAVGPAGLVDCPEGERAYALWHWVPGARPSPPFSDPLYQDFGRAAARLHEAALGFRPRLAPAADPEPVYPYLEPDDRERLRRLVAAAEARLAGAELEIGVRHGDLTLDNVHRDGARFWFYDLDLAHTGPLVTDLVGVANTPQWPAFLTGYREVRPLPDVEIELLGWLAVGELVQHLRFHYVDKPSWQGTESLRDGWAQQNLDTLRRLATTVR